jgi:hydroxymethylbilane synthase
MDILKLGTRGSPLALTQARMVADALAVAHGWPDGTIAIVPIRTTGDRIQGRPLSEVGGKALWTKELEAALLDGRIDLAVHSMKDVETWRPDALLIAAMLPRADVRDRLIRAATSATDATDATSDVDPVEDGRAAFLALPEGARLGTSSPRRAAQALHHRPDLAVVPFRGNVETRLSKLAGGEADATLLAAAGLDRLDRPDVGASLPLDLFLPAPSQGAVGIEVRQGDARVRALVAAIDDSATSRAVHAERALLDALGGTCRTPVAALAVGESIRAEILSSDGTERHAGERRDPSLEAAARDLGRELRGRASPALGCLFGS